VKNPKNLSLQIWCLIFISRRHRHLGVDLLLALVLEYPLAFVKDSLELVGFSSLVSVKEGFADDARPNPTRIFIRQPNHKLLQGANHQHFTSILYNL